MKTKHRCHNKIQTIYTKALCYTTLNEMSLYKKLATYLMNFQMSEVGCK